MKSLIIKIEKLNHGWLLTQSNEDKSHEELSAYESPGNLMMGIATALSGGATRINIEDKEHITVQCRDFR